jgi:hypothetical protein
MPDIWASKSLVPSTQLVYFKYRGPDPLPSIKKDKVKDFSFHMRIRNRHIQKVPDSDPQHWGEGFCGLIFRMWIPDTDESERIKITRQRITDEQHIHDTSLRSFLFPGLGCAS